MHAHAPLPAPPPAQSPTDLAWRVIRLVNAYRLLAAAALLGLGLWPGGGSAHGAPTVGGLPLLPLLAAVYLGVAAALALVPRRAWLQLRRRARAHLLVDTLALCGALWASGGVGSGLGVLLILPSGAMALLAERREAVFLAAVAACGLLLQQLLGRQAGAAAATDFLLTGVLGLVLFVVALVVQPLAARLRESEALLRRQELDLANLAQLSQFVVQNLRESLLVVDADDRIRLINDSAARLLGIPTQPGGTLGPLAPTLQQALARWRTATGDHEPLPLPAAGGDRLLQPHFARLGDAATAPVLVFLEDTSLLAERVQQSKLAALGRLSASIAHEIRTPVAAMSQAAQLLAETPDLAAPEQRLTQIIRHNGDRVSRLIDNVLEFSRRGTRRPEQLPLSRWLQDFAAEFCATLPCPPGRLQLQAPEAAPGEGALQVTVDPTQLRQILWNLCANALTHGTSDAADGRAVQLSWGRLPGQGRPFVEVADRGPGISESDRDRIFEPFFSTSQRGTGLGLYLARELAQANGALLRHEPRAGGGSVFRVVFSDPGRWAGPRPDLASCA
ncbi:MAG: hypothetical protein RL026_540 [Pseudomonadota bacterium]|jgi:two-component system sensor histidine kinase PilS (NtrC family)